MRPNPAGRGDPVRLRKERIMKATKRFLLLSIAIVMACEPSASTCLYEEPSTAETDSTVSASTNSESLPCDHTHADDPASTDEPETQADVSPTAPSEPATAMDCEEGDSWLFLPVRFHRLSSSVSHLNGSMGDDSIAAYLEHVNALWAQACIQFELESVVETTAASEGEALFMSAIETPVKGAVAKALSSVVSPQDLLEPGWNVVLIQSFGVPAAGVYNTTVGAVFFSEGKNPSNPTHPTILAHELGHALGLSHYYGPGVDVNLMHEGGTGSVEESNELTAEQIAAARAQAATGDSK